MSGEERGAYLRDWHMRIQHAERAMYGNSDGEIYYGQDHSEHVRLPSDQRKPEKRLLKLKNGGYGYFDVW